MWHVVHPSPKTPPCVKSAPEKSGSGAGAPCLTVKTEDLASQGVRLFENLFAGNPTATTLKFDGNITKYADMIDGNLPETSGISNIKVIYVTQKNVDASDNETIKHYFDSIATIGKSFPNATIEIPRIEISTHTRLPQFCSQIQKIEFAISGWGEDPIPSCSTTNPTSSSVKDLIIHELPIRSFNLRSFFKRFLGHFPCLSSLSFTQSSAFAPPMTEYCPYEFCSDSQEINRHLKELKLLNLKAGKHGLFTGIRLSLLFDVYPNLEHLELGGQLTDKHIEDLSAVSVDVISAYKKAHPGWDHSNRTAPRLSRLSLACSGLGPAAVAAIGNLPLKQIDVSGCPSDFQKPFFTS